MNVFYRGFCGPPFDYQAIEIIALKKIEIFLGISCYKEEKPETQWQPEKKICLPGGDFTQLTT